jgi:hypothetical protein
MPAIRPPMMRIIRRLFRNVQIVTTLRIGTTLMIDINTRAGLMPQEPLLIWLMTDNL